LHCGINICSAAKEVIMQPYTVEELEFINRGATANTKENEMFDTDEFIDTVQSAKKTMVKTFVQNETIAKSMNAFVDAQTAYTKDAVKATASAMGVISSEMAKSVEEVSAGKHFKKMQEQVSNDLYSTFWKEAFKFYSPTYK
jgi:hypothetical protein